MTRWELITSDEWIKVTVECIIRSKRPVKETREDLTNWLIQYRNELLHGDQGSGCADKICAICYPQNSCDDETGG